MLSTQKTTFDDWFGIKYENNKTIDQYSIKNISVIIDNKDKTVYSEDDFPKFYKEDEIILEKNDKKQLTITQYTYNSVLLNDFI